MSRLIALSSVVVAVVAGVGTAVAADMPRAVTSVGQIISSYDRYIGATVAVEGEIAGFDRVIPSRTRHYVLRDTTGAMLVEQAEIVPRRPQGHPWRLDVAGPFTGQQVLVIGTVGYRKGADPPLYLTETDRLPFGAPLRPPTATPLPAATPTPTPTVQESEGAGLVVPVTPTEVALPPVVIPAPEPDATRALADQRWVWALLGTLAMALVLMFILLVIVVTRRFNGRPGVASSVEGSTLKMRVPPPGTLRVLRDRFEVVGDPSLSEVRLFQAPGSAVTEITFGRDEGPAYFHIQLKPLTVSARHAKVVVGNGICTVTNFSSTNPTEVNGKELAVGESVELDDGDRLVMGEVSLVYRSG